MDRRALGLAVGLLVAAGIIVTGLSGCNGGGTSSTSNMIRIVSSLPRTGSAQGQTDSIVNGIQMAIDDYGGTVAGFKIEFSDMDDATAAAGQWAAESEGANAQKAAADKDCMVFIGPYNSGAAKVSMPILNDAGLLQISPAATWPGLTKKVPGDDKSGEPDIYRNSGIITFCRVCPTDFLQGPLSAVFAKEELKAKSVYILDDKELYGQGIAMLFKKKCEELGIKILGHESIVVTQQEFSTLMTKIKALNPDMIYFGGTTQSKGGQIAKDMKNAGLNIPMMAPDGCYEQAFIDSAGADVLEGRAYCSISGDPTMKAGGGPEFKKKYIEKYKKDPEPYAIFGYEAGKVFLEALKKVGKKDRNALREAVLATKDFKAGALGTWSFDADGDTTLEQLTVSVVKGGKFEPVRTITK